MYYVLCTMYNHFPQLQTILYYELRTCFEVIHAVLFSSPALRLFLSLVSLANKVHATISGHPVLCRPAVPLQRDAIVATGCRQNKTSSTKTRCEADSRHVSQMQMQRDRRVL